MTSAPAKSPELQQPPHMTVSLAQGGDGLGAMWGEEKARVMLRDAGFKHVQVTCLPHDILNIYYVVTR